MFIPPQQTTTHCPNLCCVELHICFFLVKYSNDAIYLIIRICFSRFTWCFYCKKINALHQTCLVIIWYVWDAFLYILDIRHLLWKDVSNLNALIAPYDWFYELILCINLSLYAVKIIDLRLIFKSQNLGVIEILNNIWCWTQFWHYKMNISRFITSKLCSCPI